jgi:phage terminase large subunit
MGGAKQLWESIAPEVYLAGPAGTGKTRALLEYVHLLLANTPRMRALSLRKTYASLKGSIMVTIDEQVKPHLDGVKFYGETAKRPPGYIYPNGSFWALGGMDKWSKFMSSEFDIILPHETTDFEEEEVEALSTRLRHNIWEVQRVVGDCNPGPPTHWLKLRADTGRCLMLESKHEDNPTVTPEYLARLDALSGVRYARLRLGLWAAAEGMVYQDSWDRQRNLINRFSIPKEWARYLSIDFGFTNPFVCQWWAEDPDGRLYRYRELYKTRALVEDHARRIKELSRWGLADGEPLPYAIVCDHDAEDRATLERHLGMSTTAAHKDVSPGIQAVASRLKLAGDGKARLFFLRDSLVERDHALADAKKPTCSEEEFESYVWDAQKEKPVKDDDHGMDTSRYMIAHRDLQYSEVTYSQQRWM